MKTNRFFGVVVSVLLAFLAFALKAHGDTIADVSWCNGHSSILWQVDLDTKAITTINSSYTQTYMRFAISPMDNNLYEVSGSGISKVDPTTGSLTPVWSGVKNCAVVAFAPDGTLYTHNGARAKLASYDIYTETGGTFGDALNQTFPILGGLVIDSDGQAFAGDAQKHLYSVNLSNGDFTSLGTVAGLPFTLRGMDYDDSGRLLAFFDTGIYSIDTSKMTSTLLMSLTPPAGTYTYQGQSIAVVSSVPEPATLTLLVSAVGGLLLFRRKR